VALELERIAMHLVGLGGLATDVAFLPGSSTYGRLRTTVINLSMRLSGSRFGRSWFRPGQLRFALKQAQKEDIRKSLGLLTKDIATINRLFQNSRTVRHRLCTTGVVTTEIAKEIGLVGMSGRASGLSRDLRHELQGGAYASLPIPISVEPSGDCWARGLVRIREIEESTKWILQAIDTIPDVEAEGPCKATARPNAEVASVEEGWRGEVIHFIQTDSKGAIAHYKLQDPSLRNWFGLAQAVKNNAIYDFPICNKSFDLSYCGNDL
jgi:Ni,Fe-hydrogenase III large subunit